MVDENNALSVGASSGKVSKGGNKRGGKTERVPKNDSESRQMKLAVDAEVDAVRKEVTGHRDRKVEQTAQEMMDIVAEAPVLVVQRFGELASEYEGNPEFFRKVGDELGKAIFGNSESDAA